MRRLAALTALAAAMAVLALLPIASARAQAIQVTAASVENRFPQGLLFHLAASGEATISEVRLRYQIQPEGVLTTVLPEFEPAASIDITFTLEGNDPPRIYLPPGVGIEYFWELTDEAGRKVTTQPATVRYDDIRFQWREDISGVVHLHWYSGSDDSAQAMLEAGRQTIDDMSALLGAQVDFPIHVWVYASASDMRAALIRRSETFERQVITAGERVAKDTVLVLGEGALDTLRHELAHIVTAVAGEGPFGRLPAWLDEGTAVFAQSNPGGFRLALEQAVATDDVISLPSLSSSPGDPDLVNLFYGQSWSLVSYLIGTYGPQKFAQLFAAFKAGTTTDDALMAVYGFAQVGLEDRWRQSLGLPPLERPEGGPVEPGGQAQPGEGGTSLGLVLGLILGLLALAAFVGVGGYLIWRRLPRG